MRLCEEEDKEGEAEDTTDSSVGGLFTCSHSKAGPYVVL